MPILALIFWLAIIGLVTYLAIRFIPMPEPMRKLIVIAVVVLCVIWILNITGLLPIGGGPYVPQVR